MNATIIIATHNRRELVDRAVRSCLDQKASPEIIVVDDASTDGTAEHIAARYPSVRLHQFKTNVGLLPARNRGAQLASHEFLFFLDDDAYFCRDNAISRVVADFDHERIAVVAIPYVDSGRTVWPPLPSDDRRLTRFSAGGVAAFRRSIFLSLGGLREQLGFYCEESELAMRMLMKGYVTRIGTGEPLIHHEPAPGPDRIPGKRYAQRIKNEMLIKWWHTPSVYLPAVLGHHVANNLYKAVSRRLFMAYIRGMAHGASAVAGNITNRSPFPPNLYRIWRRLGASPTLESIENSLPALTSPPMPTD